MCDTMVALGNSTLNGNVIFAKNSDRQPNEPHIMIRIPRKTYPQGSKVKCTYMEIEQVRETYEVLLLKPSWIWGCEMGANEFGLNIGNEAVFTREKYGEPRLIGMDMVRLALERCKTAEEALELIIELLERYGQGGNCGYEKPFTYHNSFLIADYDSAWVLETAGEYWVAEQVKDVRSISNCLSIGTNYDRAHPRVIDNAIKKGYCKKNEEFNFARCYTDRLITHFSGAKNRLKLTSEALEREKGKITAQTMQSILRDHDEKTENKQFEKASLKSVCMHGGFIFGDHTTGSYVADLDKELATYWLTGSSTPCISVFKPLWLTEDEEITFKEGEEELAINYWLKRELLHRMIINNQIRDLDNYLAERDELEACFRRKLSNLELSKSNSKELNTFMKEAWQQEEELIDKYISNNRDNKISPRGGLYYRYYWKKSTRKLGGI